MTEHRTAYWSHRPSPPLDRSTCWTDQCPNPAAATADPRWRGAYCTPCQTSRLPTLVFSAEAE